MKKIIKKLFASTIAISIIATTPGFVGAVKKQNSRAKKEEKESQATLNSKKDDGKANSGQKKQRRTREKVYFVQKNDEDKMIEESKQADKLKNLGGFWDRTLKNAFDKQSLIKEISDLILKDSIKGDSREKIVSAIFKLCEFVNDEDVANEAIDALNGLICSKNWENLCSKDEILKIIWDLSSCIGNKKTEEKAAEAINNLTVNNAWANQCSQFEIFQIFDVLNRFVFKGFDRNSFKHVVCALSNLMFDSDFVKSCYRGLMPQILNLLDKCVEVDDAREDAACFVDSLASVEIFSEFFELNVTAVIGLLKNCLNDESTYFVSSALFSLTKQGIFNNRRKEISKVINILNLCISDNSLDEKKNFLSVVFYFCQRAAYIEWLDQDNVVDIVNLLLDFCENDNLKLREKVVDVLNGLLARGLMDGYSAGYMFKIIDLLFKCAVDREDLKAKVSFFILLCVCRNLLFVPEKDETKKMLDILIFCAESKDAVLNSKMAFSNLCDKGLMRDFSEDEVSKYKQKFEQLA